MFFKVKGDTFLLEKLTYDSTTESFDVKTGAVETGLQTIFKRPKGSEHFSFVEDLYKIPPPTEKKSKQRII